MELGLDLRPSTFQTRRIVTMLPENAGSGRVNSHSVFKLLYRSILAIRVALHRIRIQRLRLLGLFAER